MMVGGGVIPCHNRDAVHAAGTSHVFGPGTVIARAAVALLEDLKRRLGHA